MARQVLEGTWEEVAQQAGELAGKRVRLEILEILGHGQTEAGGEKLPFYATASPQERARAYRAWAESHSRNTPLLSDAAISRESIYCDERD